MTETQQIYSQLGKFREIAKEKSPSDQMLIRELCNMVEILLAQRDRAQFALVKTVLRDVVHD